VKAPQELHPFHFLMAWHPRANTDPRHVWLREAMRSTVAPNGKREDRKTRAKCLCVLEPHAMSQPLFRSG